MAGKHFCLLHVISVLLLLSFPPQSVWAPPIVSYINQKYVGPALGTLGDYPYQGRDHVFHLGMGHSLLHVSLFHQI